VPVDEAQEAVLPQEVRPRKPAVRRAPPTRKVRPGDLICGECGEGNPSTRKFCSRCGESLAAAVPATTPWWHRLRPRRGPKVVKASKRPTAVRSGSGRRAGRKVGVAIRRYSAVVVIGFALLAGLYPPLRTYLVNKVGDAKASISRTLATTLNPVRPSAIAATDTELPDHPAKAAFDQFKNTYWAAPWTPNGKQPTVSVDLGKTTALAKVIITSGATEDFTAHHRPSMLLFAYSNEKSDTVGLKDTPEPQEITLRNGLAAKVVKIQVLQVYETQGATDVALTEAEFFGVG
jgi:hypothetical protein